MTKIKFIDSCQLSHQMEQKYFAKRGFEVSILAEKTSMGKLGDDTVVIVDGTHKDEVTLDFIEELAISHPGNLVLAILPGNRERFVLKRFVGSKCVPLKEADSKRELFVLCEDEVENATSIIRQLSPSLLSQLVYEVTSWFESLWGRECSSVL